MTSYIANGKFCEAMTLEIARAAVSLVKVGMLASFASDSLLGFAEGV